MMRLVWGREAPLVHDATGMGEMAQLVQVHGATSMGAALYEGGTAAWQGGLGCRRGTPAGGGEARHATWEGVVGWG